MLTKEVFNITIKPTLVILKWENLDSKTCFSIHLALRKFNWVNEKSWSFWYGKNYGFHEEKVWELNGRMKSGSGTLRWKLCRNSAAFQHNLLFFPKLLVRILEETLNLSDYKNTNTTAVSFHPHISPDSEVAALIWGLLLPSLMMVTEAFQKLKWMGPTEPEWVGFFFLNYFKVKAVTVNLMLQK